MSPNKKEQERDQARKDLDTMVRQFVKDLERIAKLETALTDVLKADIANGPHDQHAVSEIGNDRCVFCGNFWPCPNARAWAILKKENL